MLWARVCLTVITSNIGYDIQIDLAEGTHSRAFDQIIRMLVMFRLGYESADIVQRRRGAQNRGIFLRQMMQLRELVKYIKRKLAYMMRMGRIKQVFLANLFQRFSALRIGKPASGFLITFLQQI